MEMNFITPMTSMVGERGIAGNTPSINSSQEGMFKDIFQGALKAADQTDRVTKNDGLQVVMGNTDELHKVTLASTQAELSLKLFVQLRNKAHEAYSEMMRMGI